MNAPQHSPGPWHWEFNNTAGSYRLYNSDGTEVTTGCWPISAKKRFPADMLLLAAAPEMYAALVLANSALAGFYDSSEDNPNNPGMQSAGKTLEKIQAAIRQAKGEQ